MFSVKNTTASVYSSMYAGHTIKILSVEANEGRRRTEGKMLVAVTLSAPDPENIDNEVTVARAIASLVDDINDWPETTGPVLKATDVRQGESMIIHLGGDEWLACVEYGGDAYDEDNPPRSSDGWGLSLRRSAFGAECQMDLL